MRIIPKILLILCLLLSGCGIFSGNERGFLRTALNFQKFSNSFSSNFSNRSQTSNFLSNLSLLVTVPNNVLQGDMKLAGKNTARFAVNSTVGILGLFDPATKLGLNDYDKEDYGQTLGRWGMGEGCYLVLPVLGPSTVRDTFGDIVSLFGGDPWYNVTVRNDTHYVSDFDYYASVGTDGIDFRAKNIESFENLEKNSLDFYASVKSLYLQDRKRKILNSDEITDTLDDSDWEEIDTN